MTFRDLFFPKLKSKNRMILEISPVLVHENYFKPIGFFLSKKRNFNDLNLMILSANNLTIESCLLE